MAERMETGNKDGDGDIFKSAMESQIMTGSELLQGNDEIDLNDEDEDVMMDASLDVPGPSGKPSVDLNSVSSEATTNSTNQGGITSNQSNNVSNLNQDQMKHKIEQPYRDGATATIPTQPKTDTAVSNSRTPAQEPNQIEIDTGGNESQSIKITVTDPQKQGEGLSTFIVYRITTRTNIALFRRKEFSVWRRFSDFLGLHHKLTEKYLKKGRIIPPAPEKNMIDTAKIKVSGQRENGGGATNNNNRSVDFVERRRCSIERFINRIASHPVLRVDPDFRDFLEIDTDLPKSTSSSAFSGAGVVRLFSYVGDAMNKMSQRMDEADPWFLERLQNVEALENQLRKVHSSIELLVAHRRDLAVATSHFAKNAAILGNSEEHVGLARALAQLSDVWDKVEQTHNEQANSDFFLLSEVFRDYILLIGSVKDAFNERVKAHQAVQHAQQTLNKKREAKAKFELAVKNDKVAQAGEEVAEWEGKVEMSQAEFAAISGVIKKELELFESARVKEFKAVLLKYMESLVTHQQDILKCWEAFLPEANAVQ